MFDQALFDDEEVEVLSMAANASPQRSATGSSASCATTACSRSARSVEESVGWFVMAERVAEVHVKAPNGRPISDEGACGVDTRR